MRSEVFPTISPNRFSELLIIGGQNFWGWSI